MLLRFTFARRPRAEFKPLLLLALLAAASSARAQGPGSGGPTPQGPVAVPVDGGISLLLAAGAAYGLKRLRRARR